MDPFIILSPMGQSFRRKNRKEEVESVELRESRDSRGGTSPGAVQQVSQDVWGEISQIRTGRASRRMAEEVQVSSKQVEGSQHTGIAEIVSGEASFIPQLFFNSHELVILSQTLRTARGTSLDLACAQPHHQVCDERVLSLS